MMCARQAKGGRHHAADPNRSGNALGCWRSEIRGKSFPSLRTQRANMSAYAWSIEDLAPSDIAYWLLPDKTHYGLWADSYPHTLLEL